MKPSKPRKARSGSKLADLLSKPDTFLDCREMRHPWIRKGYFHWSDQGRRAICRVSTCPSCGSDKLSFFYASGRLMDTRYEYSDHYLLTGEGKVTNADVVLESIRRHGVRADRNSLG